MLSVNRSKKALRRFFNRHRVAQLTELYGILETQSRMSVFRRLNALGYFSSFTHAGRYYTLFDVPQFDQWGLWFHRDIGFSRFGTLKATIVDVVSNSQHGMAALQLRALLRLGKGNTVYNTLHELVDGQQIRVDKTVGHGVYLAADPKQADERLKRRAEPSEQPFSLPETISAEIVISVLVEALGANPNLVDAAVVSSRLQVRGMKVDTTEVEKIFAHFGLAAGKKTLA